MFLETKQDGEQHTKTRLCVRDMVAWLETQPAEQRYDYNDCEGRCLVGLYAAARGYDWRKDSLIFHSSFDLLNHIACDVSDEWTFGAALKRANQILAAI